MLPDESKTWEHITCSSCGGDLKFAPNTLSLLCMYCGSENKIQDPNNEVDFQEHDFVQALLELEKVVEKEEQHAVKCNSCAATTTLPPNVTSCKCPFCDTALVVDVNASTKFMKPHFVLPFKLDKNAARNKFASWLDNMWFAPNDLKRFKGYEDQLKGIYLPNWTYDTLALIAYRGERGDAYYETVPVTSVQNGKTVTQMQQVRKIRWSFASGNLEHFFDDIITSASTSVPLDYMLSLEPWDLKALQTFDQKYLAGFQTEVYTRNLKEGFELAKQMIDPQLTQMIYNHIGGNEQRIHERQIDFSQISFKLILLPIYISAYQYKGKVYRFVVNGQSGKIKGERPYSIPKILGAVLGVILLILILWAIAGG